MDPSEKHLAGTVVGAASPSDEDIATADDAELRQLSISDAHELARSCDVLFPMPLAVLLIIALAAWRRGTAPLEPALLLVAFTAINVALSRIGPRLWRGLTAEYIRMATTTPLAALMYVSFGGPLQRVWLPSLIMCAGQALLLSVSRRDASVGYAVTGWTVALMLAAHVGVHGMEGVAVALLHGLGIAAVGLIIAKAGSRYGQTMYEARRQALRADRARARAQLALDQQRSLQQQLVTASRQAGMAEVATGVLHNVGNVLNSVGVCASTIEEKLRASRLSTLERTVELLAAQGPHLPDFVKTARGAKIVPTLDAVAGRLRAEQAAVGNESEQLRQHVGHIKSIIARQQSFARGATMAEKTTATQLVDDALCLLGDTFARNRIELVRHDADVPLELDRARVLQVLVNLLGNARDATKNGDVRRVTVATELKGERVRLSVRDTGVGMSESTRQRIFEHGFTTKHDGHGFGLHHSANAATEMGGTLMCESDGEGQGACFTLELPCRFEARNGARSTAGVSPPQNRAA